MPETFSDHPPMAARPSAPRQRLRYARILDTAAGFARKGLDAVELSEVAEKADVPLGTLYRYFPSPTHLMLALLPAAVGRAAGRCPWLVPALPRPRPLRPRDGDLPHARHAARRGTMPEPGCLPAGAGHHGAPARDRRPQREAQSPAPAAMPWVRGSSSWPSLVWSSPCGTAASPSSRPKKTSKRRAGGSLRRLNARFTVTKRRNWSRPITVLNTP